MSWLLPHCFTNSLVPEDLKGQSVLMLYQLESRMLVKQEENKLKPPYVQVTQGLSLSLSFLVKPWPWELTSLHICTLFTCKELS